MAEYRGYWLWHNILIHRSPDKSIGIKQLQITILTSIEQLFNPGQAKSVDRPVDFRSESEMTDQDGEWQILSALLLYGMEGMHRPGSGGWGVWISAPLTVLTASKEWNPIVNIVSRKIWFANRQGLQSCASWVSRSWTLRSILQSSISGCRQSPSEALSRLHQPWRSYIQVIMKMMFQLLKLEKLFASRTYDYICFYIERALGLRTEVDFLSLLSRYRELGSIKQSCLAITSIGR